MREPDFTAEARALGYAPFVRLSPLEYLTLRELYGEWVFTDLFPRLKDPGRLHLEWAVSFAGAAASLPRAEVLGAVDVHALVTREPSFRRRRGHLRAFQRVFFHVVWRRMKAGARDIPAPERALYLADHERWRAHFLQKNALIGTAPARADSPKFVKNERKMKRTPVIEFKMRAVRAASSQPQEAASSKQARGVWRNPRPREPLAVRKTI